MPSIALPVSFRGQLLSGSRFSPASLFAASEPGVWYDPSDLTTMFQDTAGTTPVTTPGQTVARINDKSGRGNNATQATTASRPTYGIVPLGGRRNLLTWSEDFSNAVWAKLNATVTANSTVAPDGTTTADTLTDNATSGAHYAQVLNIFTADGATRFWSIYVKQGTARYISLSSYDLDITTSASSRVTFDMQTGVYTVQGAEAGTVLTPIDAGNGWWRIGFSSNTNSARYDGFRVEMNSDGTSAGASYSGTGSTAFIWGAQLETGSTATAYQKVTTQYDVTESGVQSLSYLFFDGVANFLVTPTITPGVDKAQVFVGVRKLSDAARGTIVEHSATIASNNGSFHLTAPNAASATFGFESKGTTLTDAVATFAAPTTRVVTGVGDIAGDSTSIRANGTQQDQDTTDQGTGNYLAYPLYIGRRGGTTLPFNGQIYNLIVRFGANLDAGTITSTETFVNQKTGAF